MILPDHYRDELAARLAHDIDEKTLRRILLSVGMALPEDDPTDFEELARWSRFTGENQYRGVIPLTARLELLGRGQQLHLRYLYVLELNNGSMDDCTMTGQLEAQIWDPDDPRPQWEKVPICLLDRQAREQVYDLMLSHVRQSKNRQ